MKRARNLSMLLVAGSLATPATGSAEIRSLSASDLHSICLAYRDRPESPGGIACASYLQGLLEASSRFVVISDAQPQGESFRQRALRTRAGSRQLRVSPRRCLAMPVSIQGLVDALLANRGANLEDTSAVTTVYSVLQHSSNCSSH